MYKTNLQITGILPRNLSEVLHACRAFLLACVASSQDLACQPTGDKSKQMISGREVCNTCQTFDFRYCSYFKIYDTFELSRYLMIYDTEC